METIKTEGGLFIFENCTINIYEGNKTLNHAIDVLKGVSNGKE